VRLNSIVASGSAWLLKERYRLKQYYSRSIGQSPTLGGAIEWTLHV